MNHAKTIGCRVEGCDRKHKARGYCSLHYERWKRGTPMDYTPSERKCTVEGCTNPHYAKGLCSHHYGIMRQPKNKNQWVLVMPDKCRGCIYRRRIHDSTTRTICYWGLGHDDVRGGTVDECNKYTSYEDVEI